MRGDDVYVVSQGSYGGLFEKLSITTGSHQLRCVMGRPATVYRGTVITSR